MLVRDLCLKGVLKYLFILLNIIIVELRSEISNDILICSAKTSTIFSKSKQLIMHGCLPIDNESTFLVKRSVT